MCNPILDLFLYISESTSPSKDGECDYTDAAEQSIWDITLSALAFTREGTIEV